MALGPFAFQIFCRTFSFHSTGIFIFGGLEWLRGRLRFRFFVGLSFSMVRLLHFLAKDGVLQSIIFITKKIFYVTRLVCA